MYEISEKRSQWRLTIPSCSESEESAERSVSKSTKQRETSVRYRMFVSQAFHRVVRELEDDPRESAGSRYTMCVPTERGSGESDR